MKKILALILALLMFVTLFSGCGKDSPGTYAPDYYRYLGYQKDLTAPAATLRANGIHALFTETTQLAMDLVDKIIEYFPGIDGFNVHDDWGAQRAPFFSTDTFRETLYAPLKRVVERTHELGMLYTAHCCGNALEFVPLMVECGIDSWQIQPDASDPKMAVELSLGKLKVEPLPPPPEVSSDEELQDYIKGYVRNCNYNAFYSTMDPETYMLTPELRKAIYKAGRELRNEMA